MEHKQSAKRLKAKIVDSDPVEMKSGGTKRKAEGQNELEHQPPDNKSRRVDSAAVAHTSKRSSDDISKQNRASSSVGDMAKVREVSGSKKSRIEHNKRRRSKAFEEDDEDEKAQKKRSKKKRCGGFLLEEAEEADDDDEEEEDECEEGFVVTDDEDDEISGPPAKSVVKNNRRWAMTEEEKAELKEEEERIKQTYGKDDRIIASDDDDDDSEDDEDDEAVATAGPSHLEKGFQGRPLPKDKIKPNMRLFMVKCKKGEEHLIVNKIMTRIRLRQSNPAEALNIESAIVSKGIKGRIYVEAAKESQVREVVDGITNLFTRQITMVPREDEAAVLRGLSKVKKSVKKVNIGADVIDGDLKKHLVIGSHVRITAADHKDKTGLIICIKGSKATIFEDHSKEEREVHLQDLELFSDANGMSGNTVKPTKSTNESSSMSGRGNNNSRSGPKGRGKGGFQRGGETSTWRKDRDLIGKAVKIVQGCYKGHIGIIKAFTSELVIRIELHSLSQTVLIQRDHISVLGENEFSFGKSSFTPPFSLKDLGYNTPRNGAKTPMYYGSHQTPLHESGSSPPFDSSRRYSRPATASTAPFSLKDLGYDTPRHGPKTPMYYGSHQRPVYKPASSPPFDSSQRFYRSSMRNDPRNEERTRWTESSSRSSFRPPNDYRYQSRKDFRDEYRTY